MKRFAGSWKTSALLWLLYSAAVAFHAGAEASEACDPAADQQYVVIDIPRLTPSVRKQLAAECITLLDTRDAHGFIAAAPAGASFAGARVVRRLPGCWSTASERQYRVMTIPRLSRSLRDRFDDACVRVLDRYDGADYVVSAPACRNIDELLQSLGNERQFAADPPRLAHHSRLGLPDKVAPAILSAPPDESFEVLIQFYPDATLPRRAAVLRGKNAQPHSSTTWTARITRRELEALAPDDRATIRRIERGPAIHELRNNKARALIGTDVARQSCGSGTSSGCGLTGAGAKIGIADSGIFVQHADFLGRIYGTDPNPNVDYHGTHVASIVGGSGAGNPELALSGHAPGAMLGNYRTMGTMESAYETAVGTDQSHATNHSYGLSTPDGQDGYRLEYSLIDAYVRGTTAFPAAPQVWAAGFCDSFGGFCLTAREAVTDNAKNVIQVASVNSSSCGNTRTTCRRTNPGSGPTLDLRIKPDLVAPGCHAPGQGIWAAKYALSTASVINAYRQDCGESMAAPVVSGVIALIVEQLAIKERAFDYPATFKALLVHTAIDQLGPTDGSSTAGYNDGPDPATGWGLVDAASAVRMAATLANWREDEVLLGGAGQAVEYCASVTPPAVVKVTLAWDDPPGLPCSDTSERASCEAASKLVHDLDLTLTGPDATVVLPWTLVVSSMGGTSAFMATRAADHRNNVEVAETPAAVEGMWRIRVQADPGALTQDQTFGLVSSHPLVSCADSRVPRPPIIVGPP